MRKKLVTMLLPLVAISIGAAAALLRQAPVTVEDDVAELAPGIYFRHGNLKEHSHCNNGFIVLRDFVLVVDANFPSGAEKCLEDIRKVTDKPVRFVFDTHHHGDHAYGNPTWVKYGAVPIAHEKVVGQFEKYEPERWQQAAAEREDVRELGLETAMPPVLTFPDRMVIDDGERRVDFLHYGTAHTRGDGFVYLPKEKVLYTGDAVVNGPFNYMGDGNTESWLKVLDALSELDVEIIAPGHGPCSDKSLIALQRAYIATMREQVAKGLENGESLSAIQGAVTIPDHLKRYVGERFNEQIEKIYSEMMGFELPYELEQLGFIENPSTKAGPGWTKPKKILVCSKFFSARPHLIDGFKKVAEGVEVKLVPSPLDDPEALKREIVEADALICSKPSTEYVALGKKLRWLHSISAGVEPYVGIGTERTPGVPSFIDSDAILTNGQRCYGVNIADHVFSHLLSLTRRLEKGIEGKLVPATGKTRWESIIPQLDHIELRGKTVVIVGVGGIGEQVATRADAFGMHVIAVDPQLERTRPGVDAIRPPSALHEVLPRAEVLVLSCPLTKETRNLIGKTELALLPKGAYVVNVARGRIVQTDALVEALQSGHLAGAGLDVTEPEPLPDDSPLWSMRNVTITPHYAAVSVGAHRRIFLVIRENIFRFVRGKAMLSVIDKKRGY